MAKYSYQNNLISKKQLRELLAWNFSIYNAMQACSLADELKYLGFQYATQAGISISLEDLRIPFVKTLIIEKADQEISEAEKIYLKGRITNIERFQKILDTWSLTSEALKNQIIYYFKNYDPLNSIYIMAFSGARGNLSQVRQLVGMRGLMSDPSGEIMNLPIRKNFREGLTITDYLMSGYGARKGIVDTALKTANSGYLTRRLIDVSQDILIRETNCLTNYSIRYSLSSSRLDGNLLSLTRLIGCVLSKPIIDPKTHNVIAKPATQITSDLIHTFKERKIQVIHLRSPLTCSLYRAICQNCYGWDLAMENLIEIGEAIGILAGQSIGEPGTQLTMRTFHTGGIFTAAARQQICSPISGLIQFDKGLKTTMLRTNRGEEVAVTRNSGYVVLIPSNKTTELTRLTILPNTILFPKNNQYIWRDAVIGELINTNQQLRIEIKPILNDKDGEIFIPKLKKRRNVINKNQFIWILFGKVFYSPKCAFFNVHSDYRVDQQNHIFRSKVITQYNGSVNGLNQKRKLFQRSFKLTSVLYSFFNAKVKELTTKFKFKTHVLCLPASKYFLHVKAQNERNNLKRTLDGQLGNLITNKFQTFVGGTLFYDNLNSLNEKSANQIISYFPKFSELRHFNSFNQHTTISWIEEEIHDVECDVDKLLVDHGDFIPSGFELIPNLYSKTSGLVFINKINKKKSILVQNILIKSGIVYEGKTFKRVNKRVYYPGERVLSNIIAKSLALCESLVEKKSNRLLVKPITLYELSKLENSDVRIQNQKNSSFNFKLSSKKFYIYKSGQKINSKKNLNLIADLLLLNGTVYRNVNFNIELRHNIRNIDLKFLKQFKFSNYIIPYLKYQNLQSCILTQKTQFLSKYTVIGYLQACTAHTIEIVKIKVKRLESNHILVISNNDCVIVSKQKLSGKKLNDLVTSGTYVNNVGKIIIENEKTFLIQKGQPYFFPNCNEANFTSKSNLEYTILNSFSFQPVTNAFQNLSIQYFDITKICSRKRLFQSLNSELKTNSIIEFSNFFLKKNGKLYSCLMPQFSKKFDIKKSYSKLNFQKLIYPTSVEASNTDEYKNLDPKTINRINQTVLIKKSGLHNNQLKQSISSNYQLSLLEFNEHPFHRSTKAVGLYSITEDYFEQELNSIFCKNQEFIQSGKTIGLVNLEKAITGDIVQGLPKIEEILEARKKKQTVKSIPTSQKKGILVQVSNLDPSFDFKKLGLPIMENAKINPHKLLKVYFNYYGLSKQFVYAKKRTIFSSCLVNNYMGSYRSLRKVQLFILHSVQAVYRSQGVTINDKHLEVIIKQMTTKVIITSEGDAPLLSKEVIDLYHIRYINKIVKSQMKETACYVPVLLGITKAALNNPSFVSAASFQETTRVLTKAAIESRIDWLRGLKENIIIGHLIPAGTGSQNHRIRFKSKKVA